MFGLFREVMTKKKCKYGGSALHTNKNFIRNWLFVYKLGFSRKKTWWLMIYILFRKTTEISRFVTLSLEILGKRKLHRWKSCKIVWHLLGTKQNYLWFFLIVPENFTYFLFYFKNSKCFFFKTAEKSKSLNS